MCKLVLLLLTAGAAHGFHTAVQPWAPSRSVRGPCSPWPLNPEPWTASAPLRPRVRATERQARVRGGLVALRGTRSLLEQWAEACDNNGVPAPEPSLPAADTATLLKAVAGNKPKRSDTFAEVGGGRGEAMAAALAECGVEWGQAALFLPENMQQQAEGVFATAKKMNRVFEPCQIILGNVQDLTAGSRMMTYFDVVFADTRSTDWGAGTDGPASTLSAAAGQFCLEGSRLVTVGRKLVDEEGIWSFALLQSLPLSCGAAGYVWEVTRSAKSTAPDKALVPEGAHVAGAWVKLVGLKTAPDLNGEIAVILEVDDEGILRVMLDETCRVMRVRPSNAQPVVVVDP